MPLGSSCSWPHVGRGHTPGTGWVSPGCWCSSGMLPEDAVAAQTRPLSQPGVAGAPQPFSLLPAPRHTQRAQNRGKGKKSLEKKQKKIKIREGDVGSGTLKVLRVSAPNAGTGTGQECVPVPFPRASSSSHQANHQFPFPSVAENQRKNKRIELQGKE